MRNLWALRNPQHLWIPLAVPTVQAKVSKRLPSRGPNSPFSAGGRTLLARTCVSCGVLADGDSFPILNAGTKNVARRRSCHTCVNLFKKRAREERGIGLPTPPRPPEALQTSKYRIWTAEEDKYLRENVASQSYEEIAIALGRSLDSVYIRRVRLGLSKVRKSHRVEQPWKIEPINIQETK
jgi:hypothetical protein